MSEQSDNSVKNTEDSGSKPEVFDPKGGNATPATDTVAPPAKKAKKTKTCARKTHSPFQRHGCLQKTDTPTLCLGQVSKHSFGEYVCHFSDVFGIAVDKMGRASGDTL